MTGFQKLLRIVAAVVIVLVGLLLTFYLIGLVTHHSGQRQPAGLAGLIVALLLLVGLILYCRRIVLQ